MTTTTMMICVFSSRGGAGSVGERVRTSWRPCGGVAWAALGDGVWRRLGQKRRRRGLQDAGIHRSIRGPQDGTFWTRYTRTHLVLVLWCILDLIEVNVFVYISVRLRVCYQSFSWIVGQVLMKLHSAHLRKCKSVYNSDNFTKRCVFILGASFCRQNILYWMSFLGLLDCCTDPSTVAPDNLVHI